MNALRTKLWARLTIAFVFVALTGVVLVAVLANRATSIGFARYLQDSELLALQALQADLGAMVASRGNWEGTNVLLRQSAAGPQGGGEGYFLRVVDANDQIVGSRGGQGRAITDFEIELPIIANGQRVGTLYAQRAGSGARSGEQFLATVNQAILWAGLTAILLALFLGLLLARRITRPLSRVAEATRGVAAGDLSQQVPVSGQDEVGQLAQDFNHMARALALSESQRRQLLADTAHDLRTPISIIRSHLEAMLDGVFPMTPESLATIHEETLHLSRLVDDVRTLSLAETGQLPLEQQPVDMRELVERVISAFAPLADADGVRLESTLDNVPLVTADEARIHQVLSNLIANALRYAPLGNQDPPTVSVSLQADGDKVTINIADNGPGLTAEQQQRVFDRFWRSDTARDRRQGGSGLGLAIAKSIVEAHDGTIALASTPGAGTTFTITLDTSPGPKSAAAVPM